ncbi:FtsX-like permease family protein [Streptococcus suis]|nr:FtsX-like permease family protein [Streptococcus suis]
MKKKIYWKDIGQALTASKGRFLSIFSLMMLGSLTLTGLKVTAPNMERAAQSFVDQYQVMDLAVLSGLGISQDDLTELQMIKGARVEAGYFKDVTIDSSQTAVRLFSDSSSISRYRLLQGEFPKTKDQIALSESLQNRYQLGEQFLVEEPDKNGKVLTQTSFTVVGFVASSEIWDNQTMGLASSGNGQLEGYGLLNEAAFDSEVYTIARLRYEDLLEVPYYSQVYKDKLGEHQEELEKILKDNADQRLNAIKSAAQADIVKGEDEIAQAQSQLQEAEQKLQNGRLQLETGRSEFSRGRAKIIEPEEDLRAVFERLLTSKAELDASKAELDSRKSQLDQTKLFLEGNEEELVQSASRLEQAKKELENQNAQLSQLASVISTGRSSWYQGQVDLEHQIATQVQTGQKLSDYPELLARQEELDAEKTRLDQLEIEYEQANQSYTQNYEYYHSKVKEYEAGLAQYQKWNEEYQAGLAQYQSGLSQYEQAIVAYHAGVADYEWGVGQLESSTLTLDQEALRLDQADKELTQAQSELATKKAEADKDIIQAQKEIEQAKVDINALEKSPYQVVTRMSLPGGDGYTVYNNATRSIAAVGNVFPIVLYLVAALVTFTTMARFVDEERSQSGLFKALGYTDRQIMRKFILYGLGAGLLGTILGIVAGNLILSPIISRVVTQTTVLGPTSLRFYPTWTILALALSLISSVLPAYLVAKRELTEEPARLLLPKPPVAGSTILLEKWQAVWSRLSFTHKVVARNIFRYKLRMLMTIFGVAGTVALLFGGLGIRSSISGVVERQFNELIHYDLLVVENSKSDEKQLNDLTEFLQSNQVRQSLPVAFEQLNQTIQEKGQRKTLSISLFISDRKDLGNLVSLEKASGQSIKLTDRGVILTEKLAQLYGVTVGDRIHLTLEDKDVEVRVAEIADMYAGHFIYMTDRYYEQVSGSRKTANAYLVQLKQEQRDKIQKTASLLLTMPAVKHLIQNMPLMMMLMTIADSLQTIMTILVILSVLLSLVILYNLTIVNMSERIRELSTIRVLGFHHKEVTMYIYRETIVLSFIGMVLGLGAGYYLHKLLLDMIGSDTIRFNPTVGLDVYLIPIFTIVMILAVLGWYVNHQLRKVNMLEALKSVE